MSANHLEDLVGEWLEFNGFFVRRNIQVGPRPNGGYECELDLVGLCPTSKRLIQVEPSMDTDKWEKRESRYRKKFEAGKKYIPDLFKGLDVPSKIDQVALLVYGSRKTCDQLGGGRLVFIQEFMTEIYRGIQGRPIRSQAISQQYPLLRTIQFAENFLGVHAKPDVPEISVLG